MEAGPTLLQSAEGVTGDTTKASSAGRSFVGEGVLDDTKSAERAPASARVAGTGVARVLRPRAPPRSATVTSVVGAHGTIVCTAKSTLGSAAAQMLAKHRSFALLAHSNGTMFGALTENDILEAYVSGVSASYLVGAWVSSGYAKLPDLDAVDSVLPEATLVQAARAMSEQADSEFGSRHVVIKDGSENCRRGVISCLDIVRFLHAWPALLDSQGRLRDVTVGDVMKPRESVPTCTPHQTMMQALQKMVAFRQNFVVVHRADDVHYPDHRESDDEVVKHVEGIVTTRDTLRAYVDRARPEVKISTWFDVLGGAAIQTRTVKADMPLAALVTKLATEDIHHVVVVDDNSVLVGAVSSTDVAHAVAKFLR